MKSFARLPFAPVALLLATISLPSPLIAQDTGSIIPRYDRAKIDPSVQNPDTQKLIYAFGACVAKAKRPVAEDFLKAFPFSKRARHVAEDLLDKECLETNGNFAEVTLQTEALRGPVYKALYKADFGTLAGNVGAAPPINYGEGKSDDASVDTESVLQLRQFAECAVRNDPEAARALVLADVDSSAETQAFAQFTPAMAGCVKPGDTIKLTKALVRGLTPEALYRLALASRNMPALDQKIAR